MKDRLKKISRFFKEMWRTMTMDKVDLSVFVIGVTFMVIGLIEVKDHLDMWAYVSVVGALGILTVHARAIMIRNTIYIDKIAELTAKLSV